MTSKGSSHCDWWPNQNLTRVKEAQRILVHHREDKFPLTQREMKEKTFFKQFFDEWTKDNFSKDLSPKNTEHNEPTTTGFTAHESSSVFDTSLFGGGSEDQLKADETIAKDFLDGIEVGNVLESLTSPLEGLDLKQQISFCQFIGDEISQEGLYHLTIYLTRECQSYGVVDHLLIEHVVATRLLSSSAPIPSKRSTKIIVQLLPIHEELVVRCIVIPIIESGLTPDENFIQLITANIVLLSSAENVLAAFLRSKIERQLTDLDLNLIENLLENHLQVEAEEILEPLTSALVKSSSANIKNARFGKFLLCLFKKLPDSISRNVHCHLAETISCHQTFLKKAVELELKKKTFK